MVDEAWHVAIIMNSTSLLVVVNMRTRSRILCLSTLLITFLLLTGVYWSKLNDTTTIGRKIQAVSRLGIEGKWLPAVLPYSKQVHEEDSSLRPFDLKSGRHTLVYIHIQKTGGSHFLSRLVSATNGSEPLCYKPTQEVKKRLKKKRDIYFCPITSSSHPKSLYIKHVPEMWIVSEKTYGWVCGLHAFLMEMKSCVGRYLEHVHGPRERRFHYLTILRHPIVRYVSEFLHVQRGATWMYMHSCGRNVRLGERIKPPCYDGYYEGEMWANVTLEKFMACADNWANNRQTMMLADLEEVDCLSNAKLTKEETENRLLESAKRNLKSFEFFGMSEYMSESGELFADHFSVKLSTPPHQKGIVHLHTGPLLFKIWKDPKLYNRLLRINRLDMQLYHFAMDIFEERLKKLNISIDRTKLDSEIYSLQ